MKYLVLIACVMMMACSGCIKNDMGCKNVDPSSEEAQIIAYAAANGITAVKHSSGMYYQVITPGTGATPNINSQVSAIYTGKLLNGTTFDQQTAPVKFPLSGVIEGWQIGLPLIKKGGEIKLIIPSALGYGCAGAGSIPSNSVLYFDIVLSDVQ